MTMEKQRCWLFLGTNGTSTAICQEMSRKFDLVIKVLNRRVTASVGLNALELQGAKDNIDKAVWWLKRRGIQIDSGELPIAGAKF
jgi:hypothetical protein